MFMSEAEGREYLNRAASIGVRWVREDFGWSWIESKGKGQADWTIPDGVMRNASVLGVNVLAMVGYSPAWANGGRDDKYPPINPRDYADFAAAVANRYGQGGTFWAANPTLSPRPIGAIEIWNEPWHHLFWKPEPDVAAYAAMVRAAAPAIKAGHPEIKVLISGDLHFGYSDGRDYTGGTNRHWEHGWLANLLKQDVAGSSVDAYSVHPYSESRGPYQTTIPGFSDQRYAQQWLYQKVLLIRDMAQSAGKFKPLWSTEFGWTTMGDVDEASQATFTRDALVRAVTEWSSFVERSFIYVLERPQNGSRDGAYSLLRDDLSPKPGWMSLQQLMGSGT